jgi:feruloyl esterase
MRHFIFYGRITMLKRISFSLLGAVILNIIVFSLLGTAIAALTCEDLTDLKLADTTITGASIVPEGPAPKVRGFGRDFPEGASQANIPAHCRVQLDLKPTSDSLIKMEIWLPVENWNGKFMGVGNGFFAGSIQGRMFDMPEALRLGYATAGTDTGHQEEGGDWAIGHPEKMIDFAYRSTHEMTVKAKEIIRAFYNLKAEYSYFKGCSSGGRQALMEAQRYPDDYDGIIAGSCANRHIHMWTASVAQIVDLYRHPERSLTEEKASLVNQTVMNTCDTLKEGFLNNPRQCRVDFSKLLCAGDKDDNTCLTAGQLKTVETFYGGVKNSKGEMIFSGQALGNPIPPQRVPDQGPGVLFDIVRIAFNDPDLDWRKFDLERDMSLIDKAVGYVDAVNTDLSKFKASGGKLLLTHGWNDTGITPETTIWYYEKVLNTMGKDQSDWIRLFLGPGMEHCGGGPGVNWLDSIGTLEKWVEKGVAPDQIMGLGKDGLTRPLCPYPQYAEYKGTGDLKNAENWTCKEPAPEK